MLTAQEAKDKCLQIWRYIEEHVTDPAWREKVIDRYTGSWSGLDENIKKYALRQLFPNDDPNSQCYLCEFHRIQSDGSWESCQDCSLGRGEPGWGLAPCMWSRRPYASFTLNVRRERWSRAAAAAQRLVDTVKDWQVD
ncbi:unnamed protein product [marine sediment metagenome]|uniref:Uncharacterized protein n=1 Tax=marine sediment metagenome TaxID=412755 RepID=X0TC41_9ZZZZ